MREPVSARPAIEMRMKSGSASDYLQHFAAMIKPGDKVVLWCRVSHPANASHLADQESALREACEYAGAIVVNVLSKVVLGYEPELEIRRMALSWIDEIAKAAVCAAACNASLFATETDRFVRSPFFKSKHKTRWKAQARKIDLEELKLNVSGVRLLTLSAPDALPSEARSLQTKRGCKRASNKPGPKTKLQFANRQKRIDLMLPKVLQLDAAGISTRQIEAQTGIPSSTVRRWLKGTD
jgi:hypothetical protein